MREQYMVGTLCLLVVSCFWTVQDFARILLCFAVTSRNSFEECESRLAETFRAKGRRKAVVVVVGLKKDLGEIWGP